MSEMQPRKSATKAVTPRHIPQVIVPVAPEDAREFVRDALKGTSIMNPVANYMAGWTFFAPFLRFTPVDEAHTLIEIDVVGSVRVAETLMFAQRQGEIHRFFVAIEDELDRCNRWTSRPPVEGS